MRSYNRLHATELTLEQALTPLLDVACCLLLVMIVCMAPGHSDIVPVRYEQSGKGLVPPEDAMILGLDEQGALIDQGVVVLIETLSEHLIHKGIVGKVPLVLQVDTALDCGQLMHFLGRLSCLECVSSVCVTTKI